MNFILIIVVLFAVVVFVTTPLRRARRGDGGLGTELAELEAARDAKYRELRDAELDHRTGKLSDSDYDALASSLRSEAVEILRSIDRAQARTAPAAAE